MAILRNGYENISVELINFTGNDIARQCWEFGKHAEFYNYKTSYENTDKNILHNFIEDIINGKTFPKYAFEGINVAFKINNISRICLAQLTREKGFFCSESGDVRPLTQDLLIPAAIYKNENWIKRYENIQRELESLYCDMALQGITYMDARYIMPHCQTISVSYCTSLINFMKSCASRTQNGFADEINYIYKLMRWELYTYCKNNCDELSLQLMQWLFNMSIIRGPYLRDHTYNNDFKEYDVPKGYEFDELPHNDFTKSSWFIELNKLYETKPYLLTESEKKMIENWSKYGASSTYDKNMKYTLYSAIKDMEYFNNDDRNI